MKNAITYSATNVIAQAAAMIRTLVVTRLLPPEAMGFWTVSTVTQSYLVGFDLGALAGAQRELPLAAGAQNHAEAGRVRATALTFSLIQNVLIAAVAVAYLALAKNPPTGWTFVAISVAVWGSVITGVNQAFTTFFTGAQQFVLLSRLFVLTAVVEAVTFALGAYYWGLAGLFAAAVLAISIQCAMFWFAAARQGLAPRMAIDRGILARLLSFGFGLKLVDYPNSLFTLASISWVTKFMATEAVGLFSVARLIMLQVADVSTRVSLVFSMRVLERLGQGATHLETAERLRRFIVLQLFVVVPILAGGAGLAFPVLIDWFLPKYAAASRAVIVLQIVSFFYVTNSGLTTRWISTKNLRARGTANLIGLGAMVALLSIQWFWVGDRTIEGVAWATLGGHYLYFSYVTFAVGRELWAPLIVAEILVATTIAAAWELTVLFAAHRYLTGHVQSLPADLWPTLSVLVLVSLSLLPIALYGVKRSGMWSQLVLRNA